MIAVVLGRPISGGSALAAAIVAMGYHPGLTIFGPCAPAFRPDWEDAEITPALIAGTRPSVDQWCEIMETRLAQSSQLGCAGALMKSPTFCLAGEAFLEALTRYRSVIYWVTRNEKERMDSLKSYSADSRRLLREIDSKIEDSMIDWADEVIEYESLIHSPVTALEPVAEKLGAEDRLAEAVAAIGPRRLVPCPR